MTGMEGFPRLVFEVLLFALIGLGMETAFTAATDFRTKRDKHLMGYSSLWYVPLYGFAPVFFHLAHPVIFTLPWLLRGLIYMACIYIVEFAGMGALRFLLGSSPSEAEYYQCRWNVLGLIRLDYAPAWFSAGLLFEFIFRFFRTM